MSKYPSKFGYIKRYLKFVDVSPTTARLVGNGVFMQNEVSLIDVGAAGV